MKQDNINTLWVIKGFSRLTGEYEECSIPVHRRTGEPDTCEVEADTSPQARLSSSSHGAFYSLYF